MGVPQATVGKLRLIIAGRRNEQEDKQLGRHQKTNPSCKEKIQKRELVHKEAANCKFQGREKSSKEVDEPDEEELDQDRCLANLCLSDLLECSLSALSLEMTLLRGRNLCRL